MSYSIGSIADLATIEMGQSPRGEMVRRTPTGLPLLNGPTEFGQQHPVPAQWTDAGVRFARAGDILFCVRGSTTGRMNRADQDYAIGRGIAALRARDGVDSRIVKYALDASLSDLLAGVSGSVFPNLSRDQILRHRVPVPPRGEQQAIAEVLGALDDKIAANTALAAAAEATISLAHADATRAGVVERPLLNELEIEFGEPFGGAHFSEPGVGRPLIRIRDLKSFRSQVWSTESRPQEVVVAAGDVLVGMDAEFRATPWLGEPGLLNQRVLRASHATFGRALVREMLRRPLAEVEGEKSATTVIHLNKADLARKTVDIPGSDAVVAFERLAEPLFEARIALAAENRTLAATRDALLPQLMSGKLRVRDAEAAASEAGA